MNFKKILFAAAAAVLIVPSYGQGFETLVHSPGIDHNHYSIENMPDGGYAVAGTLFDGSGNQDIHIFVLDRDGTMKWEKIIDESMDDRALDLVIGADCNITVTGYVSSNVKPELYVVTLDVDGNCITDQKLDYHPTINQATAGTNIIYNQDTDRYIVGGLEANALTNPFNPAGGNHPILLELDGNLVLTGNIFRYLSTNDVHSSVNDIVALPCNGGYFVTGSVGLALTGTSAVQGVMAIFVDNNLNMTSDISFHSTNWEHNGVSAVFDESTGDNIYLMSNNSIIHNPQISVIDDPCGTPSISNQYFLELDPTYGNHNAAGFHLKMSPWNSKNLVAMGYFRTDFYGGPINNDATPWIAEFEKSAGGYYSGLVWPAPSANFHTHGGGVFSTFSGEHPYVFEQEMFTERADGGGFVFISPNDITGDYAVELATTIQTKGGDCFEEYYYETISITDNSIIVTDFIPPYTGSNPSYDCQDYGSELERYCSVDPAFIAKPNANEGDQIFEMNAIALALKEVNLNSFEVAPNPFTENVIVNLSGDALNGELILTNAVGQVIYRSNTLYGSQFTAEIELDSYENGIYLLRYTSGTKQLVKKIIKQ